MTTVNHNNRISTWEKEYVANLDAKDGKKDGKIQASVWNEYAKEFGAPQIQNFIKLENALKTIPKYGYDLPNEPIETSKGVNPLQPVVLSEPPKIVY